MANSIDHIRRVEVRTPIIIEGLPGVGNIGKLAADLMAKKLNAEVFERVYSSDLPPQILIDEDSVSKPICIELLHAKTDAGDIIFILGESQATTPSGQYDLTEFLFNEVLRFEPSRIITLGGYGTGELKDNPRLMGVVSDAKLKPELEAAGVGFYPEEPKGGIVGATALFLTFGQRYSIPSMALIGETSGYIIDHRSARHIIHALNSLLGIDVDTDDYAEYADMIDEASRASIGPGEASEDRGDLSYIQ